MSTDAATTEEDRVSILSFDNLEEDYGLPGSDSTRINNWLSQQCRFGLEEKELPGPYGVGGPGELLSTVLAANHRDSSSTVSEEAGEAALRADSPLLGFGVDDEKTLEDPLHFPSATYVRDLPDYRAPSSRSRSTSTSSLSPKTMCLFPTLSRRPSLLRKPSLPLLGEYDESQPQAITSSPLTLTPPRPGRSRAHSNASISSFHLPTSMQFPHQVTPPLTPISPTPFIWRHTRKSNTPPVSSTLASFSFGNSSVGVRTRPNSQLHGPLNHPAHRHPPPTPQKISHTLSRSSSALSLLSLSTNNRNAVYIDEIIDIDSGADDHVADGGESLRSVDLVVVKSDEDDELHVRNEEGHHSPLIPPRTNMPNTGGPNFNALRSSQVYLGIGTNKKIPTRPPPAPPLIIDDKGGLGGVSVIDEDAIEERDHQFLAGDRSVNGANGGVYSHHQHHQHHPEEDDKSFMSQSRWSLTSSIDGISTPAGSGVVAAFGVGGVGGGGGGLFGSRKRMSLGGDKIDKAKGANYEKEKDEEEKEEVPNFTEKLGSIEEEKEKSRDKKRGRLVSFISRISSNMMAPPATFQNIPFQNVSRLSSY